MRTARGGLSGAARQAAPAGKARDPSQAPLSAQLLELYRSISPHRRQKLAGLAVLMLVGAVAEVAAIVGVLPFLALLSGESAGLIRRASGILQSLGARSYPQQVVMAAGLFMLLTSVTGGLRLLFTRASLGWAAGTGHEMAVGIERRLLSQPYAFHVEHNSSTLLGAIEKVHVVSLNVMLQVAYAAMAAVAALLIVALLVAVDPLSAAVAAIGFGSVYLLVSRLAARRLHRNSAAGARAQDERLKIVHESLGGIRDIIIDDSREVHVDAFAKADSRFLRATGSTMFIGAAPRFVIEAAATVVITILALLLWQRSGSFNGALPVLGAMAVGGFRLLPYLQQLYFSWTTVVGHAGTISDVIGVLRLPIVQQGAGIAALPLKQHIRLDGVSFRYPGLPRPAVDAVSLVIPRGSKVALVGKNGSGKSTLADLLMGLLQPSTGEILIDGNPLKDSNAPAWRRSISHVPQAIFLADTTIARNIAFGIPDDEIDRARVEDAAHAAQLDDLLSDLPHGLDTVIGERGVRLSGGQRQRLGLARALYKQAPVLVLDEATSALDSEAEAALIRFLFEGEVDRTIIMISHRPSAIDLCDIVVSLDRGRVVGVDERPEPRRQRAKA